jgi:radical SAM superfamily enzyme YgiQ (UPF0313 family)
MKEQNVIKNIMLINPRGKVYILPDGTPAHRKHCTPPLGLAYLAANLLKNGYAVNAVDMIAEGYDNEVFEEPFIVYGMSIEEILARIEKAKPDIIGISVLFSFVIKEVYEMCRAIKERYPDIPIVLGGHHPSALPNEVMKSDFVDYVLVAEGDRSIVMLMEGLNGRLPMRDVPNLYYRENGEIKNSLEGLTPVRKGNGWNHYKGKDAGIQIELDELPFPAWDIFPLEAYWKADVRMGGGDVVRDKFAVMLSTRGCPHACYFCTSALMSGYKGYRMRDNEEIVREIKWLIDTYGIEEILFLDDNFFAGKPRRKRLLKTLAKEFPQILFSAPGGVEMNALDNEMIDLLAEANFYKVLLAIEAGDQDVQNSLIDKKVNIGRVPEVIDYLKSKGIETRALYMIGFPGETRAQIQRTIDLARNLNVDDFYLAIVTPMPGTPLYDECVEKDLFIDGFNVNDIRFSAAKIKLPDTSPEELEQIRRNVWLENFIAMRSKMNNSVDDRRKKFVDIKEYEEVGYTSLREISKHEEPSTA